MLWIARLSVVGAKAARNGVAPQLVEGDCHYQILARFNVLGTKPNSDHARGNAPERRETRAEASAATAG